MAGIEYGARSGGAAFKQGSTWGTAVAVSSNTGIRVESYDTRGGLASLPNAEVGAPAGSAPDIGNESWELTVNLKCRYGVLRFLAYAFGTSGSPTQTPPTTGTTYLHTLTWNDVMTKFATWCLGFRSGAKPHEFASAKVRELSLGFTNGGEVRARITMAGSSRSKDSSTNTTTEMTAATTRAGRRQIMGSHATFRINAQAGSGLGSGDAVKLRDFEIVIRRKFPGGDEHETGATIMPEPFDEGEAEVLVRTRLRSYEADTYMDLWDGLTTPTPKKADIKFLSGHTPTDGSEMYLQIDLPYLVLASQPQVGVPGGGRIQHTLEWRAIAPVSGSAPTGMSATGPVQMFVLDEDSGAWLS